MMIDERITAGNRLITSNNRMRCAWCGCIIYSENDSGWEVFVTGNTTQPICIECDKEDIDACVKKEGDLDG